MADLSSVIRSPRALIVAGVALGGVWTILSFLAQSSSYWRDAGEFIVTAFYLDIAHPAGAPLFSQLANFFAWVPLGPIALRVNLFSSLCGVLLLAGAALITVQLLYPFMKNVRGSLLLITLFAPLCLMQSRSLLLQSGTSEVYLLHGVLIELLIIFALAFDTTRDRRWLVAMAFLGTFSTTNHASALLVVAPAALFILLRYWRDVRAVAVPALALSLLGLSLYLYLPIRSDPTLPFNTGDPSSLHRVLAVLTDARDRELRPTTSNDRSAIDSAPALSALADSLLRDATTVSRELSPFALLGAVVGLCALAVTSPTRAAILSIAAVGSWYLFRGWDPEPWTVVMVTIAVLVSYLAGRGVLILPGRFVTPGSSLVLLAFGLSTLLSLQRTPNSQTALSLPQYRAPAESAEQLLSRVPVGSPLLAEPSWFLLKYLRDIEGARLDTTLIYTPSILFPDLFAPAQFTVGSRAFSPSSFGGVDALRNLDSAIGVLADASPIIIEPASAHAEFLASIVQYRSDGSVVLVKGESKRADEEFSLRYATTLRALATEGAPVFTSDAFHHIGTRAVPTAQALAAAGYFSQASSLLQTICGNLTETRCGDVPLNNLGLYLFAENRIVEAQGVFEHILQRGTTNRAAVEKNLRLTRELSASGVSQSP